MTRKFVKRDQATNLVRKLWGYSYKLCGLGGLYCNREPIVPPYDAAEAADGNGMLIRSISNRLRELSSYVDEQQVQVVGENE